jgi:hypothetical protein
VAWSAIFTVAFSPIAVIKAANDLVSIAKSVALAGGVAIVVGTWFAVTMWAVIRLAS